MHNTINHVPLRRDGKSKKVKLDLSTLDGKALSLLEAFQLQAMKEGWTDREVSRVVEDAISADYDYLVEVLEGHCDASNF